MGHQESHHDHRQQPAGQHHDLRPGGQKFLAGSGKTGQIEEIIEKGVIERRMGPGNKEGVEISQRRDGQEDHGRGVAPRDGLGTEPFQNNPGQAKQPKTENIVNQAADKDAGQG